MEPRFSKKAMADYLYVRIEEIAKQHGFTSYTGTVQVRGASAEKQLAYGKIMALEQTLEAFNLPGIRYGVQR